MQQQQQEQDFREKEQPLTFVLIHGSWADASFWAGVAAELSKKGHTVYVPEFPGHGADPNKNVTHAMISKSVADFISSNNLHNVILIGHSFGGSVIQKVAELVPNRIKRLVFYNAFVLKDGEALADELPPSVVEQFKQLTASSKNNTITLPFDFFREAFTNLASLQQAQAIYKKAFPEPAGPLFEKLDLKKFYSLSIPKSFVHIMEDNVIPFGDPNYGWHPHMSSRLGLFRFLQLHGDHMTTAFYEPKLVARKLYEAARD
ncbi:salicylate esterase [Paenibacillus pectinilyticus]|uniref:Salicylate esterase n=1 Tax=Paenibacillus pectinilyticus TaxID=512399 RepID=A0A1C1A272_9BACL|nr:salicylate esterase [Paenibacillus pectinilyticus]